MPMTTQRATGIAAAATTPSKTRWFVIDSPRAYETGSTSGNSDNVVDEEEE